MIAKLTPKQRKFWRHYSHYHNKAAAAKYAGCRCNSLQSFSTQGNEILKSLELQMGELLDAQGLTDEAMSRPLQEGIEAQKPLIATWEGKITDQLWIADHPTRAKFLEMFHRLKGNFVDRHELTGKEGGDIVLYIKPSGARKGPKTISLDGD